jgi:ubiquinone/menaquinone biosynthesis C-methylase UbiE
MKTGTNPKSLLSTQEWYDFIALVANLMPGIHTGDKAATRRLLEMLRIGPEKEILDIGTGSGITAALIAGEVGARVTGIDISPKMVSKARERAKRMGVSDRTHFQEASVLDLPFDDGSFDFVIFESLLTILPGDPGTALAEMVRVLRPGGHIGGNEATIAPAAYEEMQSLLVRHPAIQRTYTPDSLHQGFEAAGLQGIVMEVEPKCPAPSFDMSSMLQESGCGGMISFFLLSYPKLVWKLVSDPRFRQAQEVDAKITSLSKEYMGYVLITGRKPD